MGRDINMLHPKLKRIALEIARECAKKGLKIKITDTFRTKKEQDKLYEQGRTEKGKIVTWVKYPHSMHNWGLGADFCRNDGKGAYNDTDGFFTKVGEVIKSYGLIWGGDWKLQDKPHMELRQYGDTSSLLKKYKTVSNFKRQWKEESYIFLDRIYKYGDKEHSLKIINNDGQNYVKIRDIASLLNKNISYDKHTKVTTLDDVLTKREFMLKEDILEEDILNTGIWCEFIECMLKDDITYIKVRDLAKFLGYSTKWDKDTKSIIFERE